MDWVNIIVLLDGVGVDTFYYEEQVNSISVSGQATVVTRAAKQQQAT
jgi:hypothetical protein